MVTPQSELQRLLGIPPKLWEVELKGMSDSQISYYIRINTRAGWESPERRKR